MTKDGRFAVLFLWMESFGFHQALLNTVVPAAGQEARENLLAGDLIRQPGRKHLRHS